MEAINNLPQNTREKLIAIGNDYCKVIDVTRNAYQLIGNNLPSLSSYPTLFSEVIASGIDAYLFDVGDIKSKYKSFISSILAKLTYLLQYKVSGYSAVAGYEIYWDFLTENFCDWIERNKISQLDVEIEEEQCSYALRDKVAYMIFFRVFDRVDLIQLGFLPFGDGRQTKTRIFSCANYDTNLSYRVVS